MRKILFLTGGLGFAGKHYYLKHKLFWDKIIIYDKNTYAADRNYLKKHLRKNDNIIVGDLCDFDKLRKSFKYNSYVIHFAAESHVDNSFKSSLTFTKSNTLGTHNLLEVCREKKAKKIVIISTDEVYGTIKKKTDENGLLNPTNPYSASKTAADIISQTYIKCFKLPISIIRANNLYGERQHIEKIIPATINAINSKKKLKIHGKGLTIRNFLHVLDFVDAVQAVMINSKNYQIYNIKGKNRIKIIELIRYMAKISNRKITDFAKYVKDRPFNDLEYNVIDKKIRKLGWSENYKFKKELIRLLKNNLILK